MSYSASAKLCGCMGCFAGHLPLRAAAITRRQHRKQPCPTKHRRVQHGLSCLPPGRHASLLTCSAAPTLPHLLQLRAHCDGVGSRRGPVPALHSAVEDGAAAGRALGVHQGDLRLLGRQACWGVMLWVWSSAIRTCCQTLLLALAITPSILIPTPTILIPRLLQVITPLLRTLSALHEADVVHRDIKPENLFLSTDGASILACAVCWLCCWSSVAHPRRTADMPVTCPSPSFTCPPLPPHPTRCFPSILADELLVGDFGLAIQQQRELPFLRAGTLDYMSPEVICSAVCTACLLQQLANCCW